MKIYYVRHAEPNYENHDDLMRELSEKGMADTKLVTQFLMDRDISRIVSSPFQREVDTIRDFAETVHLSIETNEAFRERSIAGVWIDDFNAFAKRQWSDFSYKLADGECLQEVQDRNVAALQDLIHNNPGKNIVIGGHGTALSTILNYFDRSFGYDDFEDMKSKMPWIVEFTFDEAGNCTSIVSHDINE